MNTWGKRQMTRADSMDNGLSLRNLNMNLKNRSSNTYREPRYPEQTYRKGRGILVRFYARSNDDLNYFSKNYLKDIPKVGDFYCFSNNEYEVVKVVHDMNNFGSCYVIIENRGECPKGCVI